MSYLHDEDESDLILYDLKFPSATRGIASGTLVGSSRNRHVVLLTSDGGKTWSMVPVKDPGHTLFFVNESVGWMVTPKGIWKTVESGRSWKKQKSPDLVRRVHFLDEQHGYALCGKKAVYETRDGGRSWVLLPASREPSANPEHAVYEAIFLSGSRGLIAGSSNPPRRESRLPDWMEPERAKMRRERPTLSILLETLDGGKTWRPSTAPVFGHIVRIDISPEGRGLALLEFRDSFEVPSEVVFIDLSKGTSSVVFRQPNRRVTDLLLTQRGEAYLAAVETPPQMPHTPVPGRLRILRSDNLSHWQEMDVDYRASGTRAILAAAADGGLWVATSGGAILKLASFTNK